MSEESEPSEKKPLVDALAYPLRESGVILLVIGTVLSAVLGFVSGFSVLGSIAWIMGVAYFNAYYHSIVEATVSWKEDPPDYPEVSDLAGEVLMPLIRTVVVFLLSVLPLLGMVALVRDGADSIWASPLVWLGVIWGVLYFPMAILKVIVQNEMAAALPQHVLPAIKRAMPRYLLLAGLLLAGIVLSVVMEVFLSRIPWAGGLLAAGASLYFMMAQARLAGVFYRDQWAVEAENEEAGDSA